MWFGHVHRRSIDYAVRRIDRIEMGQIDRDREIPKKNYKRNYLKRFRD